MPIIHKGMDAVPLYVYSCPECEVMLEELRPAVRADDFVECPICHGLCVREMSTFSTRSRVEDAPFYPASRPTSATHAPGCFCCAPRR